jgi:hypothetical protein
MASINVHLRKLDLVYAHIRRHAYTKIKCAYTEAHIYEMTHIWKLASIYAHLWKLSSVNVHLLKVGFRKCSFINAHLRNFAAFRKCAYMEFGFHIYVLPYICKY